MKKVFLLIIIITIFCGLFADNLVRIDWDDYNNAVNILRSLDVAGFSKDNYYEIFVQNDEIQLLMNNGIKFENISIEANKADFITLVEAYLWMDSLHFLYPSITDIDTLGYTAVYDYPLKILKINGVNPQEQNEGFNGYLVMGCHHAREWQTASMPLFFADSLLLSYSTDSVVRKLIDSTFIVIYPIVNPDGYYYSMDLNNPSWRKNRTLRNGYYGVDLNRNYGGGVNTILECEWGYAGSGACTHYPTRDTYCGPYQASERETQSVMKLINDYDFDISISLHSYGEMIIWPWGSVYKGAIDSVALTFIGTQMASKVGKLFGGYYDAAQSVSLYPSTGDTDDWVYGWSKFIKGKTVFPFTYEIDRSFNSATSEQLDSIYRNVYRGIYEGLNQCDYARNNKIELPIMPVLSQYNDTLKWIGINADKADYFTIKNLANMQIIKDTFNIDTLYRVDKFYTSASRSYSSSQSFKDSVENAGSGILSSIYKLEIEANDTFSFYTWYNIELDYDMAFVEISENGFEWFPLDTINGKMNGASPDWVKKSYSLNNFAGKQAYIRIRTIYDAGTLFEGIYIDDVYPVVFFGSDTVYDDSVTGSIIIFEEDIFSEEYFTITAYNSDYGYTAESDRLKVNALSFTGRQEINDRKISNIFFNPLIRRLDINFNGQSEIDIEIRIYNLLGEKVKSVRTNNDISIDLSFLHSGRYYLNIKGEDYIKRGLLILR